MEWTAARLDLLHREAGNTPAPLIAQYLGCTLHALYLKASKEHLSLVVRLCKRGHRMVNKGTRWRCPECRKLGGY